MTCGAISIVCFPTPNDGDGRSRERGTEEGTREEGKEKGRNKSQVPNKIRHKTGRNGSTFPGNSDSAAEGGAARQRGAREARP